MDSSLDLQPEADESHEAVVSPFAHSNHQETRNPTEEVFRDGPSNYPMHTAFTNVESSQTQSHHSLQESTNGDEEAGSRPTVHREGLELVSLAAPIVGMNLVQMLLVLSSAAFVGHLGRVELASCQLATTLANATGHLLLIGLTLGFETLGGRAAGAGQLAELAHMTLCCTLLLTVLAGLIAAVWSQFAGILLLLGQDRELSVRTARYMLLLIPSLFAHAWYAPLVTFLQSQGATRALGWASGATLLVHVPCTWFFIYYLGWKSDGAALATSVSYFVMLVLLAGHVYGSKQYRAFRPTFTMKKTFRHLWPLVKLGLPSSIMLCFEYWAFDVLYILCGLLDDPYVHVSALAVAMNTLWLPSMTFVGLGAALCTRVASELGSGNTARARGATRVGLKIGAALGAVTCALVMATHRWVPLIFVAAADGPLLRLSSRLILLVAAVALADAIAQTAGGVIRGCGRQSLGAVSTFCSYYLIGLPTSAILAFPLNLGVWGLVGGQLLGVLCQAVFLGTTVAVTNWERQAIKALDSVSEIANGAVDAVPCSSSVRVCRRAADESNAPASSNS
ncbi:MATE efflux family protein [Klebsormidium nitens]|uniref:Protein DETOXIFICATION n=1 Tax=Klebsormidium nitens TaxID=105231 RepID=A0A1Y1IUL5_KLENI|nr:MATE efflux family protein [Klebsormidium nitens]|eukprot:GAQ91928.1 MATE efflux family protein [Klebsormidium nitens]